MAEDWLPDPSKEPSEEEEPSGSRLLAISRKKKQTFQERYEYDKYDNADYDSDKKEDAAYQFIDDNKIITDMPAANSKNKSPSLSPRGAR